MKFKSKLTKREIEVLLLVKDGLKDNEIADELSISINTVKTHLKNSYKKLAVKNRTALALLKPKKLTLLWTTSNATIQIIDAIGKVIYETHQALKKRPS